MMQGSRSARRLQERMNFLFLKSSLRSDVSAAHDIEDVFLQRLTMPVLCLYGRDSDCLIQVNAWFVCYPMPDWKCWSVDASFRLKRLMR